MVFRLAAIAAGMVMLAASAAAQDLHQDARLGFKIRPPREFTKVPLKPDEEWIAARWMSEKAYYQTDKAEGWSFDHKPEMNVIAFVHEKVNDKVDVERKGTGAKETTTIIVKNPFKDYRDYLKRTYSEGGFYVAAEDKAEVDGVAVETLDIKVERGLQGGPRKIVTWIFKGEDADFAVQFELVESAWSKVKSDVLGSMRSFRRIAKDATPGAGGAAGGAIGGAINEAGLDDLSPAQRAARRREFAKEAQAKATSDLTDGWSAKQYGRVFVLSHVDEKSAARMAADATAVLDYLDENLGFVGPGEYVREPIVRLCKDWDEERVFEKGSSGWSFGREIVTHKDTGSYSSGIGGDAVNRACCEHWFRERRYDLYTAMPWWLRNGLGSVFGNSRAKGKSLEFFNDSWERTDLGEQIRAGKISTLKDLMRLDSEQLWGQSNKSDECAAAVRFLLTGPKKAKEALRAYLDALAPIVKQKAEERRTALATAATAKPKTEDEEDANFKEQRTQMREAERKLLDEIYARAFGGWTEADWKSLETAYQKSLH